MKNMKRDNQKDFKKVFLSSTALDLKPYRKTLRKKINRFSGYQCIGMEDFSAQIKSPIGHINELIPKCDLFIGVIGVRYGEKPEGYKKSFTQLEYEKASNEGIPCLMFLTPEDIPLPANTVQQPNTDLKAQKQFRKIVSKDVVLAIFKNQDELVSEVVTAIRNWENGNTEKIDKTDCIILCGGFSKRLWPLTIDLSKHLLPVAGEPVLEKVIDFVRTSSSIERIFLLTNLKFSIQTKEFLKEYMSRKSCSHINLLVEPNDDMENKLGPVGALQYAVNKIKPTNLLIIGGDNLFGFKLDDFIQFTKRKNVSSNAFFKFRSEESCIDYGVGRLNKNDLIVDFHEKVAVSNFRLLSTACYLLIERDVESINEYIESGGDPDSLGSFLDWLKQKKPVSGYIFDSYWFDTGTKDKYLQANWQFLKNTRKGALVGNNFIKGKAQIEYGSTIEDSEIGPSVYLGPKVKVTKSTISNSIIMKGAIIQNSILENAIVGPDSIVEGGSFVGVCGPKTYIIVKS